jgi:BNR/Asp-box repeat.
MAKKGTILVGTVGQGVMMSADDGASWIRASVRQGMHSDCIVRALLADPRRPDVVFAGTDMGLYESDDAGAHWALLDTPMKGSMVWSMAIDPVDPNVMLAGTGTPSKPGIYRTADAGKTWEQLAVDIAADCPNVGIPRPTGIAIDPTDHRHVWVGLEVDGVRHSVAAARRGRR